MTFRLGAVALVAEDEALIRMDTADMLTDIGFDVYEASTASAAFSYLETHPEVVLLFADIRMPGPFDGLVLSHRVRAQWPNMHIIVVSGHVIPTMAELPVGARFLEKPYHSARINQVMREMGVALGSHL